MIIFIRRDARIHKNGNPYDYYTSPYKNEKIKNILYTRKTCSSYERESPLLATSLTKSSL